MANPPVNSLLLHMHEVATMQPVLGPIPPARGRRGPAAHAPMPPRFELDQPLPPDMPQRLLEPMGQPFETLIDTTIDSFRLADDRRPEQDQARVAMHKILIEHTGRTFPFHRPPPPFKAPTLSRLRQFMRLADEYFFMSACYTTRDDRCERALRSLLNRPGEELDGPTWGKKTEAATEVDVAMGQYWTMSKRERLHAHMYTHALMALCHVYLNAYGCWCAAHCLARSYETNGFTDKGLAYQTLLGHMVKHIRLWDPRLRKFGLGIVDKYCIETEGWQDEDEGYRDVYRFEEANPGSCRIYGLEKPPHPDGRAGGDGGVNQRLRAGTENAKYGISLVHRDNIDPNVVGFQGPDLTLTDNTGTKKRKRDLAALDEHIQDPRAVEPLPGKRRRRAVNYKV